MSLPSRVKSIALTQSSCPTKLSTLTNFLAFLSVSLPVLSANKWIFASSAAHDSSTICVSGRKHRRTHKQNPEPKLRFCKQITSSEININFNSGTRSYKNLDHEEKEPLIHHVYTRIRPNRFYCLGRQTKKAEEKVFSTLTLHFNLSRMHLHQACQTEGPLRAMWVTFVLS